MSRDTPASGTRRTQSLELDDGDGTVTVSKHLSKGERLEIATGETSVKLDALLLEGLTWQRDRAAVDELLDADTAIAKDPVASAPVGRPDGSDGGSESRTDTPAGSDVDPETTADITISNEYSHAVVRRVSTTSGPGIEVATPGRGTSITLGVQSLRELAAVEDTYVFSVWFETPFGPEDTPVEGPL
jgi:hypothetical protein